MKLGILGFRKIKLNKNELLWMALIISGSFLMLGRISAKQDVLKVTEIMYNPESGKTEWIEIYNSGSESVFVSKDVGGLIDENELEMNNNETAYKNCHKFKDDFEVESGQYFVIADDKEDFLNDYSDYDSDKVVDSVLSLKNSGKDGVWLSDDRCETFLVNISYDLDDNETKKGYSLEDEDGKWRESYVLGGTPGEKNSEKPKPKEYSKEIRINEILPNPSENESDEEYIEIYNSSKKDIDLNGWILKDSSKGGKFVFLEETIIESKDFLVVYREDFGFSLNNTGRESVYILNPNEEEVFSISYEKALEDVSYNFNDEKGGWEWSSILTPGKKNEFEKVPDVSVKISKKMYKNLKADFEVIIGDRDDFKVSWDFGDGKKSYKAKVQHKYEEVGGYKINLMVVVGGREIKKEFDVEVENFPKLEVEISSIMPNPKGVDSENEWIEIENNEKKSVNLKGWSIATGASSKKLTNHPIENDFIIKGNKVEKITKEECNFSLGNKEGVIEIRYPDGSTAYKLKYKKEGGVKDDEVYEKQRKKWVWISPKNNDQESESGDQKLVDNKKIDSNNENEVNIEIIDDSELENQKGEVEGNKLETEKLFIVVENEDGEKKTFVRGFSVDHTQTIQKTKKHYLRAFFEEINERINRIFNKQVA